MSFRRQFDPGHLQNKGIKNLKYMKEIKSDRKGNFLSNDPSELAKQIIKDGALEVDTPFLLNDDLVFVVWDEKSGIGKAFAIENEADLLKTSKMRHRAFIYRQKK